MIDTISDIENIVSGVDKLTLNNINIKENINIKQFKISRKCSICKEVGHHKRTCKEKVEDISIENTKKQIITNKNILLPIEKITYKSNRKSVEYNGMELVLAVLMLNKNICNNIDFINKINEESIY